MQDTVALSTSGIVVKGSEVLLVRHTYGAAKGQILIPGGNIQSGEMPEQAVLREIFEETQVHAEVSGLYAVRFRPANWWAIFSLRYVAGTPVADGHETDLAYFLNIKDAIGLPELAETSRFLLQRFSSSCQKSLSPINFKPTMHSNEGWALYSL